MASLTILQVAVAGRAVRERVDGKVAQIPAAPARLVREVGLTLTRARTALTHCVGVVESNLHGAAADARLEQVLALEATRRAPFGHPEDGVAVVTVLALGPASLFPAVGPGNRSSLEMALQALGAVADGAVTRAAVHVAPARGEAFGAASLAEGYPHLGTLAPDSASGQTRCRFCGGSFEAYRTTCPSCGGAVER